MSKVDTDFNALVDQINAKLQEAANAMAEANRLSGQAGIPALIDSQYVREEMSGTDYKIFCEKRKNGAH